ncbi:MAG: hypothetical protein D6715_00660 [Calditrichaeota bacterium]|nr:MAG: hypothetical protein D6715_00660 [Calditrichota bacterium]
MSGNGLNIASWSRLSAVLWLMALAYIFPGSGRAQFGESNHPELHWQTLETTHFRIHYHQGTRGTAERVAVIAEDVYPAITGLYDYRPAGKVDFVIRDTDDYANGAAYFFDNKVEIWAENLDYILRGTHHWLRDVVTHEFTHIISLQRALKFGRHIPAGYFQLFGYESERRPDVVRGFPNVLISYPISGIVVPVWFAEGVAQFQSAAKRFDYRDSHREMILRDRVLHNRLLTLDEMGTFGKNSIGNESAYNQGFAFVRYLAGRFGEQVVRDIVRAASRPTTLSFASALKAATGVPAGRLYADWKTFLEQTYNQRLQQVKAYLKTGEPVATIGMANLFPTVSPDGRLLAYLTTGDSPFLSQNQLVVRDLQTGRERILTRRVSSSLTWSPNGRYLAYAKQTDPLPTGSHYNDLYIYDLQEEREYRLSWGLRARNPDWSHDGRTLVFVITSDGQTNLCTLALGDWKAALKSKRKKTVYYDLNGHHLVPRVARDRQDNWQFFYRKIHYVGEELVQITHFVDGRQVFHPRWSPDDSRIVFDTSTDFGRDIAQIPAGGGALKFLLSSRCDERYPVYDPGTGQLYYASDRTGIFNLYRLDPESGRQEALTNVTGGAFMPSVTPDGQVFYALYENVGYKIYRLDAPMGIQPAYLTYLPDYQDSIPKLQAAGDPSTNHSPRPYRRRFPGFAVFPRLFLDYGTVKPGLYFYTNEILNKISLLGGVDINRHQDLDLFLLFDLRLWKPTFFVEAFNQTTHITDLFSIEGYNARVNRKVKFNLFEASAGIRGAFLPRWLPNWQYRLAYTFSLYRATSGTFSFRDPANPNRVFVSPNFRYTYLRGHQVSLNLVHDGVPLTPEKAINPRSGRYISLRVSREWNRFLKDFATDRAVAAEIFDNFYFWRFSLDWEEYLPVPGTEHHTLDLRFQGGLIDRPVDDFFNFFAGGLVGLKGYPYFSIEGRRKAIGSVTYRLPVFRNIDRQLLHVFLRSLYLGAFFQAGDAWDRGGLDVGNLKTDVGLQLRLDTTSWYFLPTRLFFEAVYPLREQVNTTQNIRYKQEWRFYFGILFDFDLRVEQAGRRR